MLFCAFEFFLCLFFVQLCRYLVAAPRHPLERSHSVRIAVGNGMRPDVWKPFRERFGIPIVTEFYASTEGNGMIMVRAAAWIRDECYICFQGQLACECHIRSILPSSLRDQRAQLTMELSGASAFCLVMQGRPPSLLRQVT